MFYLRVGLLIVLAIILVLAVLFLCIKILKKTISRVIVIVLALFIFTGGGSIINLNCLSAEVEQKVQQVVDTVGDSYIKTQGNKVMVKIDNAWYDVSKLSVIGDIATKDITLRYDGKEIYVGQSGVVNAIKTLERVGLLKSEDN